jgi:glycosyltransferase involved in cell wall biosynthesis
MLRGKDIVCVSSLDWDAMWTSKQQIMHRLAKANRVLYVEEPVTMLAPLKVPGRLKRWGAAVPRLRKSAESDVWILTPPPLLPFGNMKPAVNRANQAVLARYIRWAMKRLEFGEDAILWAYLPTAVALLDNFGGKKRHDGSRRPGWPGLVVYHCVDEHSAFPGFVSPGVVAGYDNELTRRADLVITTSENPRRSRETVNPHTYTVVNAADVELFNRALDPAVPVPADLAAIPMPRLAVIGLHDSRLDLDALVGLAKADPAWQIVLIGPVKAGQVDEGLLRGYANIHLLGEKRRVELPGYLRGVSVALIPYRTNALTQNIFPLKLFEYLAAGVPAVVGGLPELRKFQDVIGVADSPSDYPRLVRHEMSRDGQTARAERIALAAENTWEHRVEEISLLVEEALRRRAPAEG